MATGDWATERPGDLWSRRVPLNFYTNCAGIWHSGNYYSFRSGEWLMNGTCFSTNMTLLRSCSPFRVYRSKFKGSGFKVILLISFFLLLTTYFLLLTAFRLLPATYCYRFIIRKKIPDVICYHPGLKGLLNELLIVKKGK